MTPTLAIVIPAYNEQATLPAILRRCVEVFAGDERLTEILVVDDLSSDGTGDAVREWHERDARIGLVRNDTQSGCVPSVLRGFGLVAADFAFFLPADGQVSPDVARRCLDVAEASGHDVVVTRRSDRRDPAHRRAISAAYNRAIRLVAPGFPASDVDSSFLCRRELAADRPWRRATAFALVELLVAAQRRGASIAEIDIEHHARAGGRAHGVRPREIAAAARGLALLLAERLR